MTTARRHGAPIAFAGVMLVASAMPCASAPHVSLVIRDSLDGFTIPYENAWSPVGRTLALERNDGLYLYDAALRQPPRRILAGHVAAFAWSPDGSWIVGVASRQELLDGPDPSTLWAVPLLGKSQLIARAAGIIRCQWNADGQIAYWTGGETGTEAQHTADTPIEWKRARRSTARRYTEVAWRVTSLGLAPTLVSSRSWQVRQPWFETADSLGSFKLVDVSNDGSLVLTVASIPTWHSLLSDRAGHHRVTIGAQDSSFVAESLSADQSWVAGYAGTDDGEEPTGTAIAIADAAGTWLEFPPAGCNGYRPRFSRTGSTVAYAHFREPRVYVADVNAIGR